MQSNYFVCTLGQAADLNGSRKPYGSINEFVLYQAKKVPLVPAVAFPVPHLDHGEWGHVVLTFEEVSRATDAFAKRLQNCLKPLENSGTVALLGHSSIVFLFTWLGLMRLGYAVLLIAPQCQPAAIVHLCSTCEVLTLFHDSAHTEKARDSQELAKENGVSNITSRIIPWREDEDIHSVIREATNIDLDITQSEETAVAYLHHTSGTSTGLPKPIAQSHHAAIGVLPHLPTTPPLASFTTTPLYHGGIADLFRCWTSNALIWLFPGKDLPITARNICRSLDVAKSYSKISDLPEVKYFSSVPYVLLMMEADQQGLNHLQSMNIVGVGGAALPAEIGDRLVQQGVNLISRFGSAECGFLLSSFRNFASDKDWQYLRNENPPKLLEFKQHDNNLSELIIKPGWPHMAKTNRADGSLATADLFAPHPDVKNAWLYHSRADSQLTLLTGKKFDPAPLEDAIATSFHLDDVLIFGNGRPFPGALLLRSSQSSDTSDQVILDAIRPIVEKLNRDSQNHARIPFTMLVPLPHQTQPLEKSSKGTIIRRVAEDRFEDAIERAYSSQEDEQSTYVDDAELTQYLIKLVQSITSQTGKVTEDLDLFSYGVDSIACMQLRAHLSKLVPPEISKDIPMSIVENCGSIRRLANFVLRKRHGESEGEAEDEHQLMLDLVKQYSDFNDTATTQLTSGVHGKKEGKNIVVLSGATGALGAHILHLLRNDSSVEKIFCLVRGVDGHAAKERVRKALEQRGLTSPALTQDLDEKITVLPAQLGTKQLGLSDQVYKYLAKEATSIIHVAWTVNFRLKLRSFVQDNIAGLRNLLDMALKVPRSHPPRFTYCSSTAAIMNGPQDQSGCFSEEISSDPSAASPLGYSQSKWVAEQICLSAYNRTSLHGRIAIVRVGQLSGDSRLGIWNTKEAWPMMLGTARWLKCLPDLGDEPVDWLPVDIAAQAFLETTRVRGDKYGLRVYHVLNPYASPTWRSMLHWLQKLHDFNIVEPHEWLGRLEAAGDGEHSALKLLGLWKEAYGVGEQEQPKRRTFSMKQTSLDVPVLKEVKPLDEAYIGRVWGWVDANVR